MARFRRVLPVIIGVALLPPLASPIEPARGVTSPSARLTDQQTPRLLRVAARTFPQIAHAAQRPSAAAGSPMRYHGGPVMTGDVRLYVIWYGDWSRKTRRRAVLTHFLSHLSGPRFAINSTYPDAFGRTVSGTITLAGQIRDRGSAGKRRVTDEAIGTVVATALASGRLPVDPNGIYLVLTSTEVDKLGFLSRYCGWHSHGRFGTTSVKFVLVGDPSGPHLRRCAPQLVPDRGPRSSSPNRDPGADAMANVLAHEIDETVTDPEFTGWSADAGEENADRCSWVFPDRFPVGRAQANVVLGHRRYLLQANWVNDSSPRCALSPAVYPAPAPRSSLSVTLSEGSRGSKP